MAKANLDLIVQIYRYITDHRQPWNTNLGPRQEEGVSFGTLIHASMMTPSKEEK